MAPMAHRPMARSEPDLAARGFPPGRQDFKSGRVEYRPGREQPALKGAGESELRLEERR
jgi:hypothetical protein